MKKIKFFSFASAVLLASAAGMTSCSSDSIEPTGGSGVAGQVVKTQFALNIPYGGNSSTNQAKQVTRMTENITQQNKHFRGISDILLLTFSGDPSSTGSKTATKVHKIGEDDNAYDKDSYRRLYRDIDIPIGTDYMIFYGTAKKANTTSSFTYGKTTNIDTYDTEKDLTKREFKLSTITNVDFANHQAAKDIIAALNDIAKSSGTDGTNTVTVAWADVTDPKYNAVDWITKSEREFLKKNYDKFIQLSAGSQNSVKDFITKLKSILIGEGTAADLSKKYLTKNIVANCNDALTKIESLTFPRDLNLPDGVAKIHWNNANSSFEYYPAGSEAFSGNNINYNKICYPAELSYFVKTSTMVSDKEMSHVNDFPDHTNWTTDLNQAWPTGGAFENVKVSSSTRTVALRDPVQYSVAVLKSTIKCDAATLKDNGLSKGGLEADQDVPVKGTGFPVTGILIGGQPESVDWKYEPTSTETFANTIYDPNMNGTITAGTSTSTPNYTLVFDNKSTDKKEVYVTIELENNSGMDFYGQDGIILKGAKFYLVGKLNPAATSGTTNPLNVDRVFVQDYITTANFNITDLRSAYNCIPDLRTSGINVGLAVDLSWKEGITFEVEI